MFILILQDPVDFIFFPLIKYLHRKYRKGKIRLLFFQKCLEASDILSLPCLKIWIFRLTMTISFWQIWNCLNYSQYDHLLLENMNKCREISRQTTLLLLHKLIPGNLQIRKSCNLFLGGQFNKRP